ncbi:hypothetical protein SFyv_4152 [Shigella flexneri Shi06HN006]|nr:hypothetical protein SFyv_4152 [Shigella flexneri Shi06HN006]EFS12362.1 hypothetical protein SF2457T_3513 [Shigella flexneri 2a str. 2457T]
MSALQNTLKWQSILTMRFLIMVTGLLKVTFQQPSAEV